jgi:hypothetical protein
MTNTTETPTYFIQYGFADGSHTDAIPFEEGDTISAPQNAVICSIIVQRGENDHELVTIGLR